MNGHNETHSSIALVHDMKIVATTVKDSNETVTVPMEHETSTTPDYGKKTTMTVAPEIEHVEDSVNKTKVEVLGRNGTNKRLIKSRGRIHSNTIETGSIRPPKNTTSGSLEERKENVSSSGIASKRSNETSVDSSKNLTLDHPEPQNGTKIDSLSNNETTTDHPESSNTTWMDTPNNLNTSDHLKDTIVNQNETSGSPDSLNTTPDYGNDTTIRIPSKLEHTTSQSLNKASTTTTSLLQKHVEPPGQNLNSSSLHPSTEEHSTRIDATSQSTNVTDDGRKVNIQMPAEVSFDFDADRSPMLKILINVVTSIDKICNDSSIDSVKTDQNDTQQLIELKM